MDSLVIVLVVLVVVALVVGVIAFQRARRSGGVIGTDTGGSTTDTGGSRSGS